MGDYHIILFNYRKHTHTQNFVDSFHSHSFVSLFNKPTRSTKWQLQLIDNIMFTNSFDKLDNCPDSKIHGAHLGPVDLRWAPCWPHELCYQGVFIEYASMISLTMRFPIFHIEYNTKK